MPGEILLDGRPVDLRLAARRHRRRTRDGPSALHAGPVADRHRERPAGPGAATLLAHPTPVRGRDRRAGGQVRAAGRPAARIWQLSVGEQQRVEILKLLYRGARILIMDEPTAVLAPQEIDELFRTLRSMTADGRSIVFISHKLGEVMAIADRITVMRRGRCHGGRDRGRRHVSRRPGRADGRARDVRRARSGAVRARPRSC